jgi:hypothetical protein
VDLSWRVGSKPISLSKYRMGIRMLYDPADTDTDPAALLQHLDARRASLPFFG